MEVIRITSKKDFKRAKKQYEKNSSISWDVENWGWFGAHTCYIPQMDCFISLGKAQQRGMIIKDLE